MGIETRAVKRLVGATQKVKYSGNLKLSDCENMDTSKKWSVIEKAVKKKTLLDLARKTYKGFMLAYRVYKDLREKGYIVTPGIKFGADFAVYEHGPGIDHAPFIISVRTTKDMMGPFEVVRAGRLATTVRKQFIIAAPNKKSKQVDYLVFKWFKA